MAIVGTFIKQPRDVRRLSVSYEKALPAGEEVTGTTLSVSPVTTSPLVATLQSFPPTRNITLSVSGGLSGETYMVTALSDTGAGQVLESEIVVQVEEIEL